MLYNTLTVQLTKRVWSNGRIPPCQGEGTGSIPVTRYFPSIFFNSFPCISLSFLFSHQSFLIWLCSICLYFKIPQSFQGESTSHANSIEKIQATSHVQQNIKETSLLDLVTSLYNHPMIQVCDTLNIEISQHYSYIQQLHIFLPINDSLTIFQSVAKIHLANGN